MHRHAGAQDGARLTCELHELAQLVASAQPRAPAPEPRPTQMCEAPAAFETQEPASTGRGRHATPQTALRAGWENIVKAAAAPVTPQRAASKACLLCGCAGRGCRRSYACHQRSLVVLQPGKTASMHGEHIISAAAPEQRCLLHWMRASAGVASTQRRKGSKQNGTGLGLSGPACTCRDQLAGRHARLDQVLVHHPNCPDTTPRRCMHGSAC